MIILQQMCKSKLFPALNKGRTDVIERTNPGNDVVHDIYNKKVLWAPKIPEEFGRLNVLQKTLRLVWAQNPVPSNPTHDCKGSLRDNRKQKAYIPFQFNCPILQFQQLHGSSLVAHFQLLSHLVVGNELLCRIPQWLLSTLPILLSLLKCIKVLLYLKSQQATIFNTDLSRILY